MLTDTLIQSIIPAARPIKKADGGGLNICVLPNGRREWRLPAGATPLLALGARVLQTDSQAATMGRSGRAKARVVWLSEPSAPRV